MERGGKLTPYKEDIHSFFEKRWKASDIADEIRSNGCPATKSTIAYYVSELKKEKSTERDFSKDSKTEVVQRKNVLKLLFFPIEEMKSISPTHRQFECVCKEVSYFSKSSLSYLGF